MRLITCDVCGNQFGPSDDLIDMTIPASFLGVDDEALRVDVCSWPCMTELVDGVLRSLGEDDEKEPDFEEQTRERRLWKEEGKDALPEEGELEKFVLIPKTPTIDPDMSPEDLAKYTEQVTGVKRRY